MRIYRTHDGRSFDVPKRISQFRSRDDFFDAISQACQIASDDLICMTQSGQQLTDELIDQLQEEDEERQQAAARGHRAAETQATSSDGASDGETTLQVFVFNRQYLYADLEPVLQELEEPIRLEQPLDEPELLHPPTPRALDAILDWCAMLLQNMTEHNVRSEACLKEIGSIDQGTRVALSNLLSHADSVKVGADELQQFAARELDRMQGLLLGHEADLKLLSMVQINPKLLPDNGKGRPKERSLADYISPSKMGAVFQACSNVHSELALSHERLQSSGIQLNDDTEGLRIEVDSTSIDPSNETFHEAIQALSRAKELQAFLEANCAPDEHGWPAAERLSKDESLLRAVDDAAGELVLLDEVCRESLRRLSADKHDMMSRSLHLLSDISSLQSEYADLSIEFSQLDLEFKSNRVDGFKHLQRLKNMLWAYGSTLIEVFRRKEFGKIFLLRSQALAELMASFSESERRRRNEFFNQNKGALPWEIKGMEETTPNLEISTGPSASRDKMLDIEREDVDQLFESLDEIELKVQSFAPQALHAVQQLKQALRQMLEGVDKFEAEFARLVEVTLLEQQDGGNSETENEDADASDGERVLSRRKAKTARENARLQKELQDLQMRFGEREREVAEAHDQEMAALRAELSKMKSEMRVTEHALEQEKSQHDKSRHALDSVRMDVETESARRVNMHEELNRLRQEIEEARRTELKSRREANEENERAHELEGQLHDVEAELEEIKGAHHDASKRVEALLNKGTSFEGELQVAQERIDDLTKTLSEARAEARETRDALNEAELSRDKAMRTYRAEADGDRAILEESLRSKGMQLEEAQALLKRKEAEMVEHAENVKNLQSQLTAADSAHEELVRQLEQAKEIEMESELTKRHVERSLDAVVEKTRVLIRNAILLSNTLKRIPSLSGQTTKSGSKLVHELTDALGAEQEEKRQLAYDAYQATGNHGAASLESTLEVLTWLTKAPVEEAAVARLESLTTLCKKWMKAYKHTNEKVQRQQLLLREKITFRSFAVGDLALFLPTRSSAPPARATPADGAEGDVATTAKPSALVINFAKPWAAFNINYPHYFLNFNGRPENEQLRDSLRQKEWIVARITKIESKVANSSVADGNLFQLAEGVTFYLLDVENWNLANAASAVPHVVRRKSASTTVGSSNANSSKSLTTAPPFRRWESTPGSTQTDEGKSRAEENESPASTSSEKLEKLIEGMPENDNGHAPRLSDVVEEPSSSKEAKDVGDRRQVQKHAVPSTSPDSTRSGLSLSLQQRSVSPETLRKARHIGGLSSETTAGTESGNLSFSQSTVTPFQSSTMSTSNQTPGSSLASERTIHQHLSNSAAPAFGRSRRSAAGKIGNGLGIGPPSGKFSHDEQTKSASLQSQSSFGTLAAGSTERNGQAGAKVINIPSRAIQDETPNPFSASPAPGTLHDRSVSDEYVRRKSSLSHTRRSPSKADESKSVAPGAGENKGKARQVESIEERMQTRKSDGGKAAHSSRRAIPLNFNSRPSVIAAPRIRAIPLSRPTIETAQGLNTFAHAVVSADYAATDVGSSSFVGSPQPVQNRSLSGFSVRSGSAGTHGGSSQGSAFSRQSGEEESRPSVLPSSSSSSNALASPSSSKRRSFFGGNWTLGRRSGSQATVARSSSSSTFFEDPEEDLSATVTDARQSLLRLKDQGSISKQG